jgi:hypothetical protein
MGLALVCFHVRQTFLQIFDSGRLLIHLFARIRYNNATYSSRAFMRKPFRINLTVSQQVGGYLGQLARIGIHGTKPTEVASALVSRQIEQLIKDGILKVGRSKARP